MGFEPQIAQLLDDTNPELRQTLCFTATWPKEVQALSMNYLKQPVQVNIGDSDQLTANPSIKQNFIFMHHGDKMTHLEELLVTLKEEFLIEQEQRVAANTNTTNDSSIEGNRSSFNNQNKFLNKRKTEPKIILFTSRKASCDEICYHLTSKLDEILSYICFTVLCIISHITYHITTVYIQVVGTTMLIVYTVINLRICVIE